jgi:uncharacterized protein (DUF885 family)
MQRSIVLAVALTLSAATAMAQDLEARRKAFQKLLADQWEDTLSHAPEFASILGDKRWNDKLSDNSAKGIADDLERTKGWLARFEAVDVTGFPEQEVLTRDLLVRDMREDLDNAKFENWKMPITQISGIHLQAPQFVSLLTFKTVKDYDDYTTRLKGLPKQFDNVIERMRMGMKDDLMPPRFLLEKVVGQVEGIAAQKPEDTPFARPLAKMPAEFSEADRTRITSEQIAAIRDHVLPAYAKFGKFVKEEYAPKGRTEPGMWSLPDGAARYAARVKDSTTTSLTPDEIHAIGLREVAAIEKDMAAIAKKLGFSDVKAFNASLDKDPKLKAQSREQILQLYRDHIEAMKKEAPKLFGRLPKADCVVESVEAFREKEAPGAQYQRPAPDGSRPGRVQVNTSDPTSRKTISMESTAYHEGVPGHHFQIAIQQELPELPPVRQQMGFTSFIEGWALYSERLGKEVGFYKDPYSDYGRLQDEMLRAIRLVVDTGFHHKKWTREQVVQFFRDHSAIDEVDIQTETDRYIVWPGQALAYKIGQLKILELREKAQKELGAKFDVRRFHDTVLGAGSLPLDVLDKRVTAWIAAEKKT